MLATMPIDRAFNVAVNHIASRLFPCGYDVSANAPETYEDLCDRVRRTGRMVVWDGASDATIFGCSETNWAFRARHDWHHAFGGHDFTTQGEAAAAEGMCRDVIALYGDTEQARKWCRMIRIEVNDQAEHYARTGDFPADQRAFMLAHLDA